MRAEPRADGTAGRDPIQHRPFVRERDVNLAVVTAEGRQLLTRQGPAFDGAVGLPVPEVRRMVGDRRADAFGVFDPQVVAVDFAVVQPDVDMFIVAGRGTRRQLMQVVLPERPPSRRSRA